MTPRQTEIARTALRWETEDLAREAGLRRATVARFEAGKSIDIVSVAKMRLAIRKRRVRFVEDGPFKGAVYKGFRRRPRSAKA